MNFGLVRSGSRRITSSFLQQPLTINKVEINRTKKPVWFLSRDRFTKYKKNGFICSTFTREFTVYHDLLLFIRQLSQQLWAKEKQPELVFSLCIFFPLLFFSVIFLISKLFLHFLSLGGVAAGRTKGDPVLSEGQAAHHRSGGEHEWLCLSIMQGFWLMQTDSLIKEPHCTDTDISQKDTYTTLGWCNYTVWPQENAAWSTWSSLVSF